MKVKIYHWLQDSDLTLSEFSDVVSMLYTRDGLAVTERDNKTHVFLIKEIHSIQATSQK